MTESPLIEELRRQYGENPRRVFARLANEYRKQGDLQTAIEICRTQVPLQPTYISGYIVLGQALYESGQLDEARATFEAAIALDPENLIALRQLGDVARQTGDLDSARSWYYRLLEVDPQNIDVAQHLRALEAAPTAAKSPALGEPVSWSDINPERNPGSVPIPPLPRLTLGAIPENLTPEIALAATPPKGSPVVSAAPPAPPPPAAPPPAPVAPPELHIAGLEELNQFTKPIGRAPTPVSNPPAPAESLPDIAAFAMPTPPSGSRSLPPAPAAPPPARPSRMEVAEEEEPPLYAPPPVPAAAEQMPPAADSLRDTMSFPTPRGTPALTMPPSPPAPMPPPPPPPPAMPPKPDRRAGVDVFGSVGDADAVRGAVPTVHEEEYDPTVGRMLQLGASAGGDMPAAFITETMAELYLQQGYHDEALRIYRQLAAARPDDASLRDRIARLESGARSSVPMAASVSEDVIEAARDRATKPNQTIRSFFGGLAAAKAPRQAPFVAPGVPAAPPAAPAAPAPSPVPAPSAPTAAPPALAGGKAASLNGLFDEKVAAADETAALALAGAYSEEYTTGTPTPAAGQPARAASQPLSLDNVFRDQTAATEGGAPAATVSFDEFFSPRDSGAAPVVRSPTPARGAEANPSPPPEADLALFHEWLDGLKK